MLLQVHRCCGFILNLFSSMHLPWQSLPETAVTRLAALNLVGAFLPSEKQQK